MNSIIDKGTALDRIHSCGGLLVRVCMGACVALFLLLSLVTTGPAPADLGLVAGAAIGAAGALSLRRLVPWAMAAATASIALTVLVANGEPSRNPSVLVEELALLVLIVRVVWQAPQRRVIPVAAPLGIAVVIGPLRASAFAAAIMSAPLGVLVAIAVGIGIYLRALDARRARALTEARRDERLELARDLPDFVAHHVTGIVVQAQAARFAARSGAAQSPEQLDEMLSGIEKAGTEALTSMRRMVGLLRETPGRATTPGPAAAGPAGAAGLAKTAPGPNAATRPVGDLAQVRELVEGFTDPPAALSLEPGLDDLPPEIATSVHRIVQEALTNARKHAADATGVRVSIGRRPAGVEVAVRDNGQGRGRRLPTGGYGLAGLAERVDALGGRMHAGPRPEGGWEVVAFLPFPDP